MSLHFQHQIRAEGFGVRYTFDEIGDGIPRHSHDPETEHSVFVESGAVKVYGPHVRAYVYAGGLLRFDSSQPHEIMAIEPRTVIFNRFENGEPASYQDLPPHERGGSYTREQMPLTGEDYAI